VDNIEFENDQIVNDFLDFWRRSSHQRIGYLIGRYEPFTEVPLGIKAVVCCIYEPPQNSVWILYEMQEYFEENPLFQTESSVKLEVDENEQKVDELCEWLGLKRVGWIFSDLWSDDPKIGTVRCVRNEVILYC
jgi:nuclear protein localization family protein 4